MRQVRATKGVSQKKTAAGVRIALSTYQYYEGGQKQPGLDVLCRLADYFDVSIDYLAGRTDVPQVVRSAQWQANQEA
ncbi:MAG: helix-turn-helix transcriptional regulator [Selenomonadaceae bacterium]|nr:helix-turn-helix transcriptional regulator [Selenomonadaceae bacterium]